MSTTNSSAVETAARNCCDSHSAALAVPAFNGPIKTTLEGGKAQNKAAETQAQLNRLPREVALSRILDSAAAAAFWGVSLPHWRRMYRSGRAPQPVKISDRKLGWTIASLIEGLNRRSVSL